MDPVASSGRGLILEFELDDALTGFSETSGVDFQITDVKMLANIHTVDSALANSYASHVLRGNPLHLHYSTVVASRHLVTDSSFDISLVRGFTRLKAIFAVFVKAGQKKATVFASPFDTTANTDTDSYNWQITIGSRRFPERAATGVAGNYQYFRQAAGTFYGTGSHNIMPDRYRLNLYILGCNLEKVPDQASHSGISTKDGSNCAALGQGFGSRGW